MQRGKPTLAVVARPYPGFLHELSIDPERRRTTPNRLVLVAGRENADLWKAPAIYLGARDPGAMSVVTRRYRTCATSSLPEASAMNRRRSIASIFMLASCSDESGQHGMPRTSTR
jgi:hypothetical protein